MKSELFAFEKLKAYKYARALVRSVYKLLRKLPYEEKDALRGQLQRAVISVPSNIAEGMGRKTIKAKQQFIEYSYGSLMEVLCQLQLANDLDFSLNSTSYIERLWHELKQKLKLFIQSFPV